VTNEPKLLSDWKISHTLSKHVLKAILHEEYCRWLLLLLWSLLQQLFLTHVITSMSV